MSQQINLINPLFLKQRKYFSAKAMVQGLGLLALGLALTWAYIVMERDTLARRLAEVQRQHKIQQERFQRLTAELSPDRAEQEINARLQTAEKDLASRRAAYAQLSSGTSESAGGYATFLRAFARQAVDGLWLTGLQVEAGGQQMTVKGRALQADLLPSYIQRLGREEVLKGRRFDRLDLIQRPAQPKISPVFVEFSLSSSGALAAAQGQGVRAAK